MTTEQDLIQAIYQRVQGLPTEFLSEERVKELVRTSLDQLVGDDEFQRKMRFGGSDAGNSRLTGSKFSRWGFDIGDVEFLHDLMRAAQEANPNKFKGPSEALKGAFADISDALYISEEKVKEMDKRAIENVFPRIPKAAFSALDRPYAARGQYEKTEAYQRAMRAMDTAETGYGLQLVGAQYVGELWQAARQQSMVFRQLETFEMTDPTAYLPVEADLPEMLFVPESTASNSANYATSKTGSNRVQVDAKKFVIHQMWSGEMEEDSIIPYVPFLRRQTMKALAHYSDSVVLNGDTTNAATGNINLDDADPPDTKHYLAFDGLRHVGIVDATGQSTNLASANITYNDLVDLRSKMVDTTYLMDWGHPTDPTDLIYVADPTTNDRIARLDEIINWNIYNGRTLTPNGAQVGMILGHPVISSIAMSKTEADGKVSTTGANNILGQVVAFNRRGFVVGWRRRVKMMLEPLPGSDQMRMVHSLRLGFGRYSPTGAAAGIKAAAVIYAIGLT